MPVISPGSARKLIHLSAILISVLCAVGCGKSSRFAPAKIEGEVVPVKGIVKLDGQPATKATVLFQSVGGVSAGASQPSGSNPMIGATSDERGEFEILTNGAYKGLPPGKYKLAVSWPDPSVPQNRDGDLEIADLIPEPYRNFETSGLEFVVAAGDPHPLVIDLQTSVAEEMQAEISQQATD